MKITRVSNPVYFLHFRVFSVRLNKQNSLEQWQKCLNKRILSLFKHLFLLLFKLKKYFRYVLTPCGFSTTYWLYRLHTLYTQLCRITLVAQVLPRLLAPVFATTSFCTYQHYSRTWSSFTTTIAFITPVKLLGYTFVHCPIFFTAAVWWGSFHTPCGWFFSQIN